MRFGLKKIISSHFIFGNHLKNADRLFLGSDRLFFDILKKKYGTTVFRYNTRPEYLC
jgi:hypothetical protein